MRCTEQIVQGERGQSHRILKSSKGSTLSCGKGTSLKSQFHHSLTKYVNLGVLLNLGPQCPHLNSGTDGDTCFLDRQRITWLIYMNHVIWSLSLIVTSDEINSSKALTSSCIQYYDLIGIVIPLLRFLLRYSNFLHSIQKTHCDLV